MLEGEGLTGYARPVRRFGLAQVPATVRQRKDKRERGRRAGRAHREKKRLREIILLR